MIKRFAAAVGAAGTLLAGLGTAAAAAPTTIHPAVSTSSLPVAYNYYKGFTRQHHYYGSVRPRALGTRGGPPDAIPMRWSHWNQTSAFGHGVVTHMGRHPVTLWLHNVQRASGGTRYFQKMKETWLGGGGVSYFHWNGRDWVG